jgi:hypothetical protein
MCVAYIGHACGVRAVFSNFLSAGQHAGASRLLPHHHHDGKDNVDRASQVPPLGKRTHIKNMYELRQVDYDCGYRTTGEIVHCPEQDLTAISRC